MLKDRIALRFTPDGQPTENDPLAQRGRSWQLMIQSSTFTDALTRLIVRFQSTEWRMDVRNRMELRSRLQQIRLFRVRVFARLFATYLLQPEGREIATNVPHGSLQYAVVAENFDIYIFNPDTSSVIESKKRKPKKFRASPSFFLDDKRDSGSSSGLHHHAGYHVAYAASR